MQTQSVHASRRTLAPFTQRLLVAAILCAVGQTAALGADLVINNGDHKTVAGGEENYDNIVVNATSLGFFDNGAITVSSGGTLNVTGDMVNVNLSRDAGSATAGSVNLLRLYGGSQASIAGNIDITSKLIAPNITTGGTNIFWAGSGSSISLGSAGSSVRIWSIGRKPDALSAKDRSSVILNSTNNQIVGSVDFLSDTSSRMPTEASIRQMLTAHGFGGSFWNWYGASDTDANKIAFENEMYSATSAAFGDVMGVGSRAAITLDGQNSYWFGDEQNGSNLYLDIQGDGFISSVIVNAIYDRGLAKSFDPTKGASFELVLKNGAQWSYFGISDIHSGNVVIHSSLATLRYRTVSIPKRLSALTLEDGGIVNLFDANIQAKWLEIGLDTAFPEVMNVKHNYVRLGTLKGSGGIFRLDLNVDDKSKSDMIFIENAEGAGTFKLEPYNIENLGNVSPTNTLRFATVSAAAVAGGVRFVDKVNLKGQKLYDYELEIGKETYSATDARNADYEDRVYEDEEANFGSSSSSSSARRVPRDATRTIYTFNSEDYEGGENWFIRRIIQHENDTPNAVANALDATWLFARSLDRMHQRLGEVRYSEGERGLWARTRYEQLDSHGINLDRSMVQIGADFRNTERNRVGVALAYHSGDADYSSLKGKNDFSGYSLMAYNTWIKENGAWLDLTASVGRVHSELTGEGAGAFFTGDYHANLLRLGIESGHRFDHDTDRARYFIEPELQLQWMRLGRSGMTLSNGVHVENGAGDSLIGRAGVRLGREWRDSENRPNQLIAVADILHEFRGTSDSVFTAGDERVSRTLGKKGTWFDLGVSGEVSLSERSSLYVDVLKNFGGGYDGWLLNAAVRYAF